MPKVIPLNEKGETVRVVLDRMLERADNLDQLVMVARWKDEAGGGWFVDWSNMTMGTFVYAKEVLHHKVNRSMDAIYDPDASNSVDDNLPHGGPSGDTAENHDETDHPSEGNVSRFLDRVRPANDPTGQITEPGTEDDPSGD